MYEYIAQRDENRTHWFEHFHTGVNAAYFDRFLMSCKYWGYSNNFTKNIQTTTLGRFRKMRAQIEELNYKSMNELKTFKEISVGGLTKEALIQRLIDVGVQFNQYAHTLFEHRSFSPEGPVEKLKLVKIKLPDLGLKNPCTFQSIVDRASESGLGLCPLHLGAFLRLEYLDQMEGPYLTIVSSQPENDESYPTGFYIRNFENSLWLRGYRVTGEPDWPIDNEFIFCKESE